jgi:hypothetical protein
MHVASVAGEKDNACARGELLLGEGRVDWLLLGAGRGNEHPFGSIKQWMHQGAFLMRGLANVRAEFSLTALAYNFAPRPQHPRRRGDDRRRRGLRRCGSSARMPAFRRPSGRIRRPMGRKRLKFLPARSLRHLMLKSWSFRTVCVNCAWVCIGHEGGEDATGRSEGRCLVVFNIG